jgi:hypothetical protein
MGYYPHVVIGIPFERVEALAQSLGVAWPYGTDPDEYAKLSEQAGIGRDYDFRNAEESLGEAIAAYKLPSEVTDDIYEHNHGGGTAHIFDDEGFYPGLFGFDLYSSYTNKGLPEAAAAGIGGGVQGFRMTPELIARGETIRAALAAEIPLFAEATLGVFYVHW